MVRLIASPRATHASDPATGTPPIQFDASDQLPLPPKVHVEPAACAGESSGASAAAARHAPAARRRLPRLLFIYPPAKCDVTHVSGCNNAQDRPLENSEPRRNTNIIRGKKVCSVS